MKAKAKTATAAKAKAKIDLKAVTVPKMKFVQPKPAPAKGKAKTAPPTVTAALIASVETDKTKVANGNRKGFSPPFVPDLSEVRAAAAAKATAKRQKLHGDLPSVTAMSAKDITFAMRCTRMTTLLDPMQSNMLLDNDLRPVETSFRKLRRAGAEYVHSYTLPGVSRTIIAVIPMKGRNDRFEARWMSGRDAVLSHWNGSDLFAAEAHFAKEILVDAIEMRERAARRTKRAA